MIHKPPTRTVGELTMAVRRSWTAMTSAAACWTPARPALGQCAVTALVVQDVFGGELLRAVVCGQSHYWNRLPNGEELDLTADQFNEVRLETEPQLRAREYVLSFPDTAARYEALRAEVLSCLDARAIGTLLTSALSLP